MRRLIALTAAPALLLAAAARAEVPAVVTDIPAVQSLAAQVMGDLGAPAILLERGGNAHGYQMKPSQARALQDADLIFWVGPEMTPWLKRAVEGASPNGKAIALLHTEGTLRRTFGAGAEGQTQEREEHVPQNRDDEHHRDDEHDHGGTDPHAWLDPANAQAWLGVIAAELAAADPENAAAYSANAAAAARRIAALDAQIAAELAPVKDRPFVVVHDAYGYFADHYGLTIAGTVSPGDAAEPGAERLSGIRRLLEEAAAVCVFPEAQHDPRQIAALVDGTPVRLGRALDPEGSSLPFGPELYPALLTGLATTIADCLAG
ncbi:MAG: zinc ABC transporter substrate-binding protein [Defluviimonas sp.]|nr:zinc ABC transporter substrate-binding protein [Defluviimonas sp.]